MGRPVPRTRGSGETSFPNLKPPIKPPVEVQLTNHWLHKGGIVLHFEGVDSITAAEALKGLYAAIPRIERAPLADGEAYISDLVGCLLVDVAHPEPKVVGPIEDVDRSAGPVALLVVQGPNGETLIPFAQDYLRRIDLESRRVEMALPEGLVDLPIRSGWPRSGCRVGVPSRANFRAPRARPRVYRQSHGSGRRYILECEAAQFSKAVRCRVQISTRSRSRHI